MLASFSEAVFFVLNGAMCALPAFLVFFSAAYLLPGCRKVPLERWARSFGMNIGGAA
jgi:hypothetical protein